MTTLKPPPVQSRYRQALAVAEFRALLTALILSMLGQNGMLLAINVLIYTGSGSPLLSALAFTVSFLPHLFAGSLLSGLIDRLPQRRLLVAGDLLPAGLVTIMALPGMPAWALLATLFCVNLPVPLTMGVRGALVAELLPREGVIAGRSLLRVAAHTSQIAGFAVGGALVAALSPRGTLLGSAAVLGCSALLLRRRLRHRPRRGGRPSVSLARDSLRGAREVFSIPGLPGVLLFFWLVPFFVVWPEGLGTPYVETLGRPPADTGWWLAALPAGTAVGELAGVWLIAPHRRRSAARLLAAAGFVPLLGFAVRPDLPVALVLLMITGLCSAYTLAMDHVLLDIVPERLLGRVYGVNTAGLVVTQGLGFAAAGALAEALAPHLVIACAAVSGLTLTLLFRPAELTRKETRR